MDSLAAIAITSFLVGLSGAMMPGPVLTVTIGETAARLRGGVPGENFRTRTRGALAGPLIVLGHGILEILLVMGVVLGLGKLLIVGPVIGTIALLGGAVLLWMAWGMLRSVRSLSLQDTTAGEDRRHPVLAGILTTLCNPYWIIWWATIGLSYIALSLRLGLTGLISFYIGHILSDLLWYGSVSLTLALGRRLLTDRTYRGLVTACAVLLLGFGLYFGYAGVRYLLA
ncbi:MAG: LysE family transporter [candidate division NC10 bacterium]|nr:LysE family transporter [candidate division NC10 bacterium]MBI2456081.1 LysE family transporter [candidate division NC10 bacterium]MBI3084655.1 LysE family transporter [candidate division NC10 bacterium]